MVSYIIVSYNTKEFTIGTIRSIVAHCSDCEIIVVDNASVDGTQFAIKETFSADNVKLVENKDNVGFSKANNIGAKIAKGDFLVFINPDTEVKSDIGKEMYKLYLKKFADKNVILSPTILNPDGSYQHHLNVFPVKSIYVFFKHGIKSIRRRVCRLIKTDWITGVCLCMTKAMFDLIGGWNEQFELYMEDMEICFRAIKKYNGKVYSTTDYSIIHYGNQSGKKVFANPYEREKKCFNSMRKFYSIYFDDNKFVKYLKFIYKIKKNENVKRYCKEVFDIEL